MARSWVFCWVFGFPPPPPPFLCCFILRFFGGFFWLSFFFLMKSSPPPYPSMVYSFELPKKRKEKARVCVCVCQQRPRRRLTAGALCAQSVPFSPTCFPFFQFFPFFQTPNFGLCRSHHSFPPDTPNCVVLLLFVFLSGMFLSATSITRSRDVPLFFVFP